MTTSKNEQGYATGHVAMPRTMSGERRVDHAHQVYVDTRAELLRLADEEDRLREALGEVERALADAEERAEAARISLTLAVLLAEPRELPTINQWHRLAGPFAQVRSKGRIIALVPTRGSDIPDDLDQLPDLLTLAIVDLDQAEAPLGR